MCPDGPVASPSPTSTANYVVISVSIESGGLGNSVQLGKQPERVAAAIVVLVVLVAVVVDVVAVAVVVLATR